LLDWLRDDLRLTGTHMGCMTGHCGACTVMVDGKVAKSCITLAATVQRKQITTLEGLKQSGMLSPVQQAFWDEAGFQCGFCAPGMLLTATELLNEIPNPTDDQIRSAIAGNLCRCTGYQSIVRAVRAAARVIQEASQP
jgi:carbon-monoxide dehydrogenase small subunit